MKKRLVSLLTAMSVMASMTAAFGASVFADDFEETSIIYGEFEDSENYEIEDDELPLYDDSEIMLMNEEDEADTSIASLTIDGETTEYGSIQSAVSAVPEDGTEATITLLEDTEISSYINVKENQNIIFDLNGKTITSTVLPIGATLSSRAVICNSGKAFVKNGILTTDRTQYGIINNGEMIIDGIEILNFATYGIYNYANTVVVENAVIEGSSYAMANGGDLTVKNGTFKAKTAPIGTKKTANITSIVSGAYLPKPANKFLDEMSVMAVDEETGMFIVSSTLEIPTAEPTAEPTATPTVEPTAEPTATPTAEPTAEPTATPTVEPTATPTVEPTAEPTATPTVEPTAEPTATPTVEPTAEPTATPTVEPTAEPTATPTVAPTATPTAKPSKGGNGGGGGSSASKAAAKPTEKPAEPTDTPVIIDDTEVPLAGIMPFDDVKSDDWFHDDVQYVFDNDLMTGTAQNAFSPELTTKRGMIVTILYRLEGEPEAAEASSFKDVKADAYYANAVAWGTKNGIVTGYDAETFGPDNNITREQLAAILYRYSEYKNHIMVAGVDVSMYSDAKDISGYALEPMKWAVAEGLINGITETTLAPAADASRAQVASIIARFSKKLEK